MPSEVSFVRPVTIANRDSYINDCCVAGDLVADALLPAVRSRYGADIESGQEDWGWFIWFRSGDVRLAIDIHTDDADAGTFRIHLTSRVKRFILSDKVVDTPDLEQLGNLVTSALEGWGATEIRITPLDSSYM